MFLTCVFLCMDPNSWVCTLSHWDFASGACQLLFWLWAASALSLRQRFLQEVIVGACIPTFCVLEHSGIPVFTCATLSRTVKLSLNQRYENDKGCSENCTKNYVTKRCYSMLQIRLNAKCNYVSVVCFLTSALKTLYCLMVRQGQKYTKKKSVLPGIIQPVRLWGLAFTQGRCNRR